MATKKKSIKTKGKLSESTRFHRAVVRYVEYLGGRAIISGPIGTLDPRSSTIGSLENFYLTVKILGKRPKRLE